MQIVLSEFQKKLLSRHAYSEEPNESCAMLFGNIEGQRTIVKDIFFTKNIDKSPINFTISNEQIIECYKTAEERNIQVVGIFHSHPDSEAYPSDTDKKFMYINPVVWLIYSGAYKDFRAYVLESDIIEIIIETS